MHEIDAPENNKVAYTGPVYTLTVIDTIQIQPYVFGSNRLAENVGASELVELATRRWAYEALTTTHNLPMSKDEKGVVQYGPPDPARTIDGSDGALQVDSELVYAGGGNTVLLFRKRDEAIAFTRRLTRRVLIDAPGLELVIVHRDVKWEDDDDALSRVMGEILGQTLARKKLDRTPSLPLLGLGVTAACRSTGLAASAVAVMRDEETGQEERRIVAREIAAKLDAAKGANRRLESLLPRMVEGDWKIPRNFDDLGRIHGEEGYLAVVHADGNGMGRRVGKLASRFPFAADNRHYIAAMREFSQAVESAARQALTAATDTLADALQADPELPMHNDHFPLHPIVFGGDDVTFVCNGRYGLALAARYLQAFEEATNQSDAFDPKPAYACAGVVIVKLHYPFARAYHLSEALCDEAKAHVRAWADAKVIEAYASTGDRDASALDWQFAISGITGTLEQIREREYSVRSQHGGRAMLYARPLLLRPAATWRTWPIVRAIVKDLQQPGGDWAGRRNKVKALREALRRGPQAVTEFLRTYRLLEEGLPDPIGALRSQYVPQEGKSPGEFDKLYATAVAALGAAYKSGWDDGQGDKQRSVYFDPIEIMDLYTDLQSIAAGRAVVVEGGV